MVLRRNSVLRTVAALLAPFAFFAFGGVHSRSAINSESGTDPGESRVQTNGLVASSWGLPVHLSSAGTDPAIAADVQGNGLAAWREGSTIRASSFTTQGWSSPAVVGSNHKVSSPSVAFAAGEGWVVWSQAERGADRIFVRPFALGQGWGGINVVSRHDATDPASASQPVIASDATRRATAVWLQPRVAGGSPDTLSSTYVPGSGWSAPKILGGTWSETPAAVMSGGNAVAIWTSEGQAYNSVRIAEYNSTTGWGPTILPWGRRDVIDQLPRVAINSSGASVAVWSHGGSLGTDIYASHRNGIGWSAPERIEWDQLMSSSAPKVGIDSAGGALAVWRQGELGTAEIWIARYRVTGGWSAAERLSSRGATGDAQLVVQPNGDAFVVWPQDKVLWLARLYGGIWSFAAIPVIDGRRVRIAASEHGGGVAIWQQPDGIWAAPFL